MFMGLLIHITNTSNHTKCVSLINRKCEIQPTFIVLHPSEWSQEFYYYPITVKLNKTCWCVSSITKCVILLMTYVRICSKQNI